MRDFTHQWKFTRDPSDGTWADIIRFAHDLMRECPNHTSKGAPLRLTINTYTTVNGIEKIVPVNPGSPSLLDMTLDGVEAIQFNGAEPQAGEPFSMPRCTDEQSVNTYRRPYDELVLALFILIADHCPDLLHVDSPASWSDWEAGHRIAQLVRPSVRIDSSLIGWQAATAGLSSSHGLIDRPASLDFRG